MNYLAHAFLSGNNHDLLVGNFIADHLRGNRFTNFSPAIIEGIYHHRRIDTFTDAHPAFKASKRQFYDGFERYSGILIDIYFDYFLARDFEEHSMIPLNQFSEEVYTVYQQSRELLPQSSSRFLDYVIKNNIYSAYSTLPGIEQVLTHLSHRISHGVRLQDSLATFRQNETELQANFHVFFKEASALFLK